MLAWWYMRNLLMPFIISACFLFVVVLVVPQATQAAGLVPCDGVTVRCQACSVIELANNIIRWLVGIMSLICGIVVAVAGLKFVMSGGDSHARSEGKEMMANALVGFIILLSAWLVVDTIMKTFVKTGSTGFGPWNQITCVSAPTGPAAATTTPSGATTTPSGDCTITTYAPVTDPLALQMEGGATVIWENTNPALKICADKFTRLAGGSVTSAYRPAAYQTHLKELHTKWCDQGLQSNTNPACATVKAQISAEMNNKHGLSCSRPVASASNHTLGNAVDISGTEHGSQRVLNAANESCLTWFGSGDPVHYTLKGGACMSLCQN